MRKKVLTLALLMAGWMPVAQAQSYSLDLSLEEEAIYSNSYVIAGKTVRIYATVTNHSDQDLFGTVKFYDEKNQAYIGEDQPVSVLAGRTDDVFVDWKANAVGSYPITARVIPWEEDGDDPNNNKRTTSIYVDLDSDGDGIPNHKDSDDDNDGVPDKDDAFPLDPTEWADDDGDGIGNNADDDDDGDGVPDIEDAFPNDPSETKDSDGDGVGDNSDAFPFDPTETHDSDGDGVGDNADPNNNNKRPEAKIDTKELIVSARKLVTFNAINSTDADGEIVKYEWDFGEGVENTSVIAEKIFEKPGVYDVTLTVTDDQGEQRMDQVTVTVIHNWQKIVLFLLLLLLILLVIYAIWRATRKDETDAPSSSQKSKPAAKKRKTRKK